MKDTELQDKLCNNLDMVIKATIEYIQEECNLDTELSTFTRETILKGILLRKPHPSHNGVYSIVYKIDKSVVIATICNCRMYNPEPITIFNKEIKNDADILSCIESTKDALYNFIEPRFKKKRKRNSMITK